MRKNSIKFSFLRPVSFHHGPCLLLTTVVSSSALRSMGFRALTAMMKSGWSMMVPNTATNSHQEDIYEVCSRPYGMRCLIKTSLPRLLSGAKTWGNCGADRADLSPRLHERFGLKQSEAAGKHHASSSDSWWRSPDSPVGGKCIPSASDCVATSKG